jgi:predicted AAA+ superfamily ATPase
LSKKEMERLFEVSNKLINNVSLSYKRYLFNSINWQGKLIEINGARGVGKTMLMLQKARLLNSDHLNQAVYLTLDDPYFYGHSIIETADKFAKYGGKYLFFDEVHKYPAKHKHFDWSAEIKNIYDKFPELKVIYTGSSLLKLYKGHGDLSRRKLTYNLAGLSFREYLSYNKIADFNSYPIEELLKQHTIIASDITKKIKIIPHFIEYLYKGYYPFYNEDPEQYYNRLKDVVSVILETDIPSVTDIPFETSVKLKKLLAVIAGSAPMTPNLTKVGNELYIPDQRTLLKYINYLEKAELITLLSREAKGNQIMRKPNKIYLNNPNLMLCFDVMPNTGTMRETFFANQVSLNESLKYPLKGDFLLNDKWIFEIGGKNKSKKQIRDLENGFLALDDIETGFGNVIPLWLFGFLY